MDLWHCPFPDRAASLWVYPPLDVGNAELRCWWKFAGGCGLDVREDCINNHEINLRL